MAEVLMVPRTRLIEEVLAAPHAVLIEAGGGMGKSVLVDQVCSSFEGTSLKLRLPRQRPTTRDELEQRLLETAGRDGEEVRVEELLGSSEQTALLVVDNAEMLIEDAASWLAELAQDGAPALRLIVSARLLPPGLAAMEFGGTAARYSSQDLLLAPEESAALAGIEIGGEDAERLAPMLHELSDGWMALLLVMLRRLARATDRNASAADLFWHPGLIGQLVDHFADDIDPADRDMLVQIAHLPMVNESLLNGLGAEGVLQRLTRAGIPFVVGADGWWRLCRTVTQHLISLAPLDPALARRAAPLLVAEGVELAAASVLADSGDPESAVQLLAHLPARRINMLDPMEFTRLMARLGPAAETEPQVLMHLARTHSYVGQLAEERDAVGRALRVVGETMSGDDDLTVEIEAAWLIQRALRSDPDALARIEDLLDTTSQGSRPQASLLEALGVALSAFPDEVSLRRAENAMRQSAITWRELDESMRAMSAQRGLAMRVLSALGKTDEAAALLEHLANASETPYDRMLSLVFKARLLALSGEPERTEATLRDGLPLAELLEIDWVIGHAAWTRMIVAADRRDQTGVLEQLARAESHLGQLIHGHGGLLFLCEAAEACAAVGAEAPSARLLAVARQRRGQDPAFLALTEAMIDARGGDTEAADTLQKILNNNEVAPGLRWKAELLSGYARHLAGDDAAANQSLQLALELAASLGHPDLGDRRESHVVDVLRAAIATARPDDDEPSGADEYAVKVLGGFEVRRGDEILDGSGRVSELVKHLALAGGDVPAESVVEALWPDELPGVGQRRLKNVLARARAAYGRLVQRRRRHLHLSARVDLDHFEELARAVAISTDCERVERARNALECFTGPVLPEDLYDDRIAQRREAVRRRVLGLIDVVLATNLEAGDLDEAVARLEAATDLDPCDQERPLRVVRALVEHGRDLEAHTVATRIAAAVAEQDVPLAVEWYELDPNLPRGP